MGKKNILDTKTRIIIGGIGGIAPLIISLLVIDFKLLIVDIAIMDLIGLGVRCLVLVFIGALVGYLHQDEVEPFKVFQLGIAAPALLTTAINGYGVVSSSSSLKEFKKASYEQNDSYYPAPGFIKTANVISTKKYHAPEFYNANAFRKPTITNFERFLRGLIGKRIGKKDHEWFIIVGSHRTPESANKQVRLLKKRNFIGKIYLPGGKSKYYAVVIGANLKLSEAQKMRQIAIRKGLPKDTYLLRR